MLQYLSEMLELIGEDIAQTRVTDHKYGGEFNHEKNLKRTSNELGRGRFSKVMGMKKDPHMVQKKTIMKVGNPHPTQEDGFTAYIDLLLANDLMDNIHFPKVYEDSKVTDKTGTERHKYTMERLVELSALSDEEIESIGTTHFHRMVYSPESIAEKIDEACQNNYGRKTFIKLESLRDACEIVQEIAEASRFRLDLHEGNVMARRTPYGLQLVISDPLGHSSAPPKALPPAEKYN